MAAVSSPYYPTARVKIVRDRDGDPRCTACTGKYVHHVKLIVLPCGHTIHNDETCLKRFTPFRCIFQCPAASADKNLIPAKCRPMLFEKETGSGYRDKRMWLTPESNPPGLSLQAHRNPTVSYAVGTGSAQMNAVVNDLPSFHAPELGIHRHKSRNKVVGVIKHRKALVVSASDRISQLRAKMFEDHVQLGFKQWILDDSAMQRMDLWRFKSDYIGSLDTKRAVWRIFVRKRNWWYIPSVILSDRSVARDDFECIWLCEMDRDYRCRRPSPVPLYLKQVGVHRWWNGFRFLLDSVKEAFWRNETGRWISADDTSWRWLSTLEIESAFPTVHPTIQALRIPAALAIPTPPTPYYYGVRMARLQKENPNSDQLKMLDLATYGETLIMILCRFHSEMVFAGRLHVLPKSTIDELEKRASKWDLHLNMTTVDIIKAMRYARTIPAESLNTIGYQLPKWATKQMSLSYFTWSLMPRAEADPHCRTGLELTQELFEQTSKFVLTETRRTCMNYTALLRRLLHRVELQDIPFLTDFIDEEFGPDTNMIQIGRVFERLVLRAPTK